MLEGKKLKSEIYNKFLNGNIDKCYPKLGRFTNDEDFTLNLTFLV